MSNSKKSFWDIFTNAVRSSLNDEGQSKDSNYLSKESFSQKLKEQERQAIVEQTIHPLRNGRVRFRGSWWPAHCKQDITLIPGEIVYVVGRHNITLIVEPASSVGVQIQDIG